MCGTNKLNKASAKASEKKSKKAAKATGNIYTACPPFPKQPWIFMSDPLDDNAHAEKVKSMIEAFSLQYIKDDFYTGSEVTPVETLLNSIDNLKDARGISKKAIMVVDKMNQLDSEISGKIKAATKVREHAAKSGRTFASVNLYKKEGTKKSAIKNWGPNHLELSITDLTVQQVADKVYKWLFTVIPPIEHIFLLTQAKLEVIDKKQYPDYESCTLADIKKQPKDTKVQFCVVITSKPVVVPNTQRLHWTVADKTGTGNFYFQWRNSSSQYTWDWVQALQPGDIKSLPRMTCIQVREPRRVRVAKIPLRTASLAISTVGLTIKAVGHGLVKVGDVMSMGKSSEYVPSGDVDVKSGKKIHWGKMFQKESEERKNKVEKARKEISQKITKAVAARETESEKTVKGEGFAPEADSDSDASTLNTLMGSEKDVLSEKEFV